MTLIKYHFIRINVKLHDKNDKCITEHTTQTTVFNTKICLLPKNKMLISKHHRTHDEIIMRLTPKAMLQIRQSTKIVMHSSTQYLAT